MPANLVVFGGYGGRPWSGWSRTGASGTRAKNPSQQDDEEARRKSDSQIVLDIGVQRLNCEWQIGMRFQERKNCRDDENLIIRPKDGKSRRSRVSGCRCWEAREIFVSPNWFPRDTCVAPHRLDPARSCLVPIEQLMIHTHPQGRPDGRQTDSLIVIRVCLSNCLRDMRYFWAQF